MSTQSDQLRFILGLKLKALRQEREASLQEVASRAGMSVSYLSEIEKGRKYPKPDKLLSLADAFDVPYDQLVSLQVDEHLGPVKSALSSSFVQHFPFELFGLETEDLFGLFRDHPQKTDALIRTLVEVGRSYDIKVEHFLFAALRSYQQTHANYFPDLEQAAASFRGGYDWSTQEPGPDLLRDLLVTEFNYEIDDGTLEGHELLGGFRSLYRSDPTPKLYINSGLMPRQRAFLFAREIGFQVLDTEPRPHTSSWIRARSFDEVLNNFRASYFAGALLMPERQMLADLTMLFDQPEWNGRFLTEALQRYQATPEMFFYRLTEMLPHHFGLSELFFMRFNYDVPEDEMELTKVLNMSRVAVPYGIGLDEHYCRRWPEARLLQRLARRETTAPIKSLVEAQRSHFFAEEASFFVFSMARPLALSTETTSCVSIGLLINDAFRREVAFADDPDVPTRTVHLTCERCSLGRRECGDRVAPPSLFHQKHRQEAIQQCIDELFRDA